MRRLRLRVLQITAFVREGVLDVARQPRLLLVLVLGPFLVLVVFGWGYRAEVPRYSALLVVPEGSALSEHVERNAEELDEFVDVAGVAHDEAQARADVLDGDVDVVVVFPADPLGSVLSGERAQIEVVHDRLDPIERSGIVFAAQLAVDAINAQVLAELVSQGQDLAGPFAALAEAVAAGTELALATDDSGEATLPDVEQLRADSTRLALAATALDAMARDLQGTPGEITELTSALASSSNELDNLARDLDASTTPQQRERMRELAATIPDVVADLGAADAAVLVRPFESDVDVERSGIGVSDYYAPAAVMLLLQHLGITLGALTFVRDRRLGIVEVLQVAPVGRTQVVAGKVVSNLLLGAVVAGALVALAVGALGVPLAGAAADLALLLVGVLAASLVIGFVLSLVSATDAQAIQWSMLVLLASLFFSGFFLSVDQLQDAAKGISWVLPATWGISQVHDVMLRGRPVDAFALVVLAGTWLAATVVVLRLVRTRMGIR